MREPPCQLVVLKSAPNAPTWLPADFLVQGGNALLGLTLVLFAARVAYAPAYVALHIALAAAHQALVRGDLRRANQSSVWTFLHAWCPLVIFMLVYFELDLLIPQLHPFADYPYDRVLQDIDVWLLGDPVATVARVASAPVSELLTVCYWSYYVFPLIVPTALYLRGANEGFRAVVAILLFSYVFCYLGYVLCPAVGPHRQFDGPRLAALNGYGLAGAAYRALASVRVEPPDAFPSGHAMVGMLVPALALRWSRPLFAWLAPIGAGMVVSTVYLRYHYLADVFAAFVLAPIAWKLGLALDGALQKGQGVRGFHYAARLLQLVRR